MGKKQVQAVELIDLAGIREQLAAARTKILAPLLLQQAEQNEIITTARTRLAEIDAIIAEATGEKPQAKQREKGTRTRLSDDEKKELASAVYAFIKAGGKEGVKGKDINARYQLPKAKSVKVFLKEQGMEIGSTGTTTNMRYVAE